MQRLKEFNKEHPMITRTLVGIVVYILLLLLLWWFTSPETPTQRRAFAQLMVQIAGGSVLLFGLYFAWRRVEISQRTLETQQDQQVTERFTRAIDQLGETDDRTGEPKVEIRLGGIYALERIAKDSPERDYSTVIEVLTAYVRENAPHYPNSLRDKADEPQKPAAPPEHRAAIRAITDVIRRLHGKDGIPEQYLVHLDLHNTNLQRANL